MRRRAFLIGFATVALGAAGPLRAADDPARPIIDRLRAEGFGDIATKRTFIGRIRITASKLGESREVVIDPRTGEILRDLTRQTASDGSDRSGGSGNGSGSDGSGSGSGDDGADDGGSGEDHSGGENDHSGSDHGDDGGDDGGNDDD